MKSLLDALQEGRLVELPTNQKSGVLEYLALLLEAVPNIHSDIDIVKEINGREAEGNTGIGKGIAIPHIRVRREGELLCAIGWSPQGIDYNAADGKKVHIVIMYFVPDNARVSYLKELSSLAKAVSKTSGDILFGQLPDIHNVRNKLLDWVELSVGDSLPDATARMIRLEAKHSEKEASVCKETEVKPLAVIPFTFLAFESGDIKILSQDKEFVKRFEGSGGLSRLKDSPEALDADGFLVSVIASSAFPPNRIMRECVAIKRG